MPKLNRFLLQKHAFFLPVCEHSYNYPTIPGFSLHSFLIINCNCWNPFLNSTANNNDHDVIVLAFSPLRNPNQQNLGKPKSRGWTELRLQSTSGLPWIRLSVFEMSVNCIGGSSNMRPETKAVSVAEPRLFFASVVRTFF